MIVPLYSNNPPFHAPLIKSLRMGSCWDTASCLPLLQQPQQSSSPRLEKTPRLHSTITVKFPSANWKLCLQFSCIFVPETVRTFLSWLDLLCSVLIMLFTCVTKALHPRTMVQSFCRLEKETFGSSRERIRGEKEAQESEMLLDLLYTLVPRAAHLFFNLFLFFLHYLTHPSAFRIGEKHLAKIEYGLYSARNFILYTVGCEVSFFH